MPQLCAGTTREGKTYRFCFVLCQASQDEPTPVKAESHQKIGEHHLLLCPALFRSVAENSGGAASKPETW